MRADHVMHDTYRRVATRSVPWSDNLGFVSEAITCRRCATESRDNDQPHMAGTKLICESGNSCDDLLFENISDVVFNVVLTQQFQVLVLKTSMSMMLTLLGKVLLHGVRIGMAHRECAVSTLPLKTHPCLLRPVDPPR